MKAHVSGLGVFAARCVLASVNRIGRMSQRNTMAGLAIVIPIVLAPWVTIALLALAYDVVTLIIPATVVSLCLIGCLVIDAAYRQMTLLSTSHGAGFLQGGAYLSVMRAQTHLIADSSTPTSRTKWGPSASRIDESSRFGSWSRGDRSFGARSARGSSIGR